MICSADRRGEARGLAAFGVLVATLVVTGIPGRAPMAGALGCVEMPGNHVAVVIDFESAPGAPKGIEAQCVPLGSAMTGMQALQAATGGSVGFDASSKVCQIQGVPATFDSANCSAPRDGKISYWAYFHGSQSGWTWSSAGAGSSRARADTVEGWHFITVKSGAVHVTPPPRNITGVGPSYRWQSTCPAAAPPVRHRTSVPTRSGGGAAPGGGAGTADTGSTNAPVPDRVRGAPGDASAGGGPSITARPGTKTGPQATTTTLRNNDKANKPGATATRNLRSDRAAPLLTERQLTATNQVGGGKSTNPLPGIIGVCVLVVVMGVALWRVRRRRVTVHDED